MHLCLKFDLLTQGSPNACACFSTHRCVYACTLHQLADEESSLMLAVAHESCHGLDMLTSTVGVQHWKLMQRYVVTQSTSVTGGTTPVVLHILY